VLYNLIIITERQAVFFSNSSVNPYAHQIMFFKDYSQILDKQFKHV